MSPAQDERASLFFEDLIASYISQPRFQPRHWLEQRVQGILDEPDCRFVLLTAEPGAGKTSFMTQLANEHQGWLRYFIRRSSTQPLSSGDARSFLFAIGHQLAASQPELFNPERLKLEVEQDVQENTASGKTIGIQIDDLKVSPFFQTSLKVKQKVALQAGELVGISVRRAVVEERFLELDNLQALALFHPARALRRSGSQEKIVILVDALDELRYQPGAENILRWLASCPELPPNVRLVLSSRPDDELLAVFRGAQAAWLRELPLPTNKAQRAKDPQGYAAVQADLQAYAEGLTSQAPVRAALDAHGADRRRLFVRGAVQKADGNLGYLDALARTIDASLEAGDQAMLERALSLDDVPATLNGLHAFFLQQIQSRVQNDSIELQDASTGETHYLKAWPAVYRRILAALSVARQPLLLDQVRRLGGIGADVSYVTDALSALRQILNPTPGLHSFYHDTLPEFLTASATQSDPAYQQLAVNPLEANRKVVSVYRKGAASWAEVDWEQADDYGLLQLPAHLQAAGPEMAAQLPELVSWPVRRAMLARFQTDGAFQALVDLAAGQALQEADVRKALPQVFFLALARAQAARSGNWVHPKVLGLMTRLGAMDRALVYLALMDPGLHRFRSAIEVYSHASAEQLAQASDQLDIERLVDLASEVSTQWNKQEYAIAEAANLAAEQDYPRALQILERVTTDYHIASAHRDALAAAMKARPAKEALQLLRQELNGNEKLKPSSEGDSPGASRNNDKDSIPLKLYLRLIRRLFETGKDNDALRLALQDIEELPGYAVWLEDDGEMAALLAAAWYGVDAARSQALLDTLRQRLFTPLPPRPEGDEARYAWQDVVEARLDAWVETARLMETIEPELSNACREALQPEAAVFQLDQDINYLLNEWHEHSIEAAEGWLRLGDAGKARQWLEAVVSSAGQRTSRYRWRLLTRAAQAMRDIDAGRSDQIVALAAQAAAEARDPMIGDIDVSGFCAMVADWNPRKAIEIARQILSTGWDETEGDRLSLLARAGLALLKQDGEAARPEAQALLDEIMETVQSELQAGTQSYGARDTPDWAEGDRFEQLPQGTRFFYSMGMMNGYNDWVAMRRWRIFRDPMEVVRAYNDWQLFSIASPFCLGRTLRCLSESIASQDANLAVELANSIEDDLEAAIAYAGLFEAQALAQPEWADQALNAAAGILNRLVPPGESFLQVVNAENYPQQVMAYIHLWVQGLVEVAARTVRFHPQYHVQLLQALPVDYLKHSLLAKSADSFLDGSQETFIQQAQQILEQSGQTSDDPVLAFHRMMATTLVQQIGDPIQVSLALTRMACSLARFSPEQATEFVEAIPDELYRGLAWAALFEYLPAPQRTPERLAVLVEHVQAEVKEEMNLHLRAALEARAAQLELESDASLARARLQRIMDEIQAESPGIFKLMALCELVEAGKLREWLLDEQLRHQVEAALPSMTGQNEHIKELLLALPRLVFYLPEVILPRLYQASRSGVYAVLALIDHTARLAAQEGGPDLVRALAQAIERARACQGEGY